MFSFCNRPFTRLTFPPNPLLSTPYNLRLFTPETSFRSISSSFFHLCACFFFFFKFQMHQFVPQLTRSCWAHLSTKHSHWNVKLTLHHQPTHSIGRSIHRVSQQISRRSYNQARFVTIWSFFHQINTNLTLFPTHGKFNKCYAYLCLREWIRVESHNILSRLITAISYLLFVCMISDGNLTVKLHANQWPRLRYDILLGPQCNRRTEIAMHISNCSSR